MNETSIPAPKFTVCVAWTLKYKYGLNKVYAVSFGDDHAGWVAYCNTTREWLAYDAQKRCHFSFEKTRKNATKLLHRPRKEFNAVE